MADSKTTDGNPETTACKWEQDVDGDWDTGCGHRFVIIEGMPSDNDMLFCCYCGKQLDENPSGEPREPKGGNTTPQTCAIRWVEHEPGFLSLMLGRVELAQISRGTSGHWFWSLRLCQVRQLGERVSSSSPTEAEARAVAEEHARKVLA
jgi:hypothetical protein